MIIITINSSERDLNVVSDNENYYNYFAFTKIINNTCFILNSEATSHICCNKSYFSNLALTDIYVLWDKISKIKALKISDVSICFKDINKKTVLKNCLLILQFDINLILINSLINNNFKVLFSNNTCNIFKQNALITKVNNYKELYLLFIISKMHNYSIKENNDVLSYNKAIYSVITNNSIIENITTL